MVSAYLAAPLIESDQFPITGHRYARWSTERSGKMKLDIRVGGLGDGTLVQVDEDIFARVAGKGLVEVFLGGEGGVDHDCGVDVEKLGIEQEDLGRKREQWTDNAGSIYLPYAIPGWRANPRHGGPTAILLRGDPL